MMPRLGQLLSALLIALIGVLVIQMFLFAALRQAGTGAPMPAPDAAAGVAIPSAAPPGSTLGAAPPTSPVASAPYSVVVIVVPGASAPAAADDGTALIERFIALTDTPRKEH